jgi:uncharacterized protein DUF3310
VPEATIKDSGVSGQKAVEATTVALDNLTATRLPELAMTDYEAINHPAHYGGEDNIYETIKVIEAWDLGFNLGNAVKYVGRAGRKPGTPYVEDLKKALFYLQREIERCDR